MSLKLLWRPGTYLALESEKPAKILSKMLRLITASGIKGARDFSDCSITVRTDLSDIAQSCTNMGTQLWRNTCGSSLPMAASFESRFTDTWMDWRQPSLASMHNQKKIKSDDG